MRKDLETLYVSSLITLGMESKRVVMKLSDY
jgi:hypothetical protein